MDSLREDLDHLVHSPGWLRFLAHVEQEWGTPKHGGGARFTLAARAAANDTDDVSALSKMRQVCFAQKEVLALVGWVDEQLKQSTKEEQELVPAGPRDYSRRGGL
jgi:hypothetical protein